MSDDPFNDEPPKRTPVPPAEPHPSVDGDTSVDDLLNTVDLFPEASNASASAPASGASSAPAAGKQPAAQNIFPDFDDEPGGARSFSSGSGSTASAARGGERSFGGGSGGGGGSGPGGAGQIIEITVSDPEKRGDGMTAYVSYKISTKVETSAGRFEQSSVMRRYSDFDWLHTQLEEQGKGWLIPPLPGKALYGRFNPMFVDSRRRGLELFLNRVARHKELSKCEDFATFLYGDNVQFQQTKQSSKDKSSGATGFLNYFSQVAQTVSNQFAAGREREKTKEDLTCETIEAYAEKLEVSVAAVHKSVETLTKRTKEISTAWFDFGFACTILGQYETEQEERDLGNAFAKLGNCSDRLSVLLTQQVDAQIIHFEEPFMDFLRILTALKEMLKVRSQVAQEYGNALAYLEDKNASLLKYQGRQGKEARALQLEREVSDAQQQVDKRLSELQEVTERVFEEVHRFNMEKKFNFKNAFLDFVRMQIEHSRKIQTAWENVLPEIEALPFDEPQ